MIERTSLYLTLKTDQIERADEVGRKRRADAKKKQRPARNGAPIDEAGALRIDIMGARTELVGKLFLDPIIWHDFTERSLRGLPDLGDFIDVKGRARADYELVVQKDQPREWAYLLIRAHDHPRYEIVGWKWGHEAKVQNNWRDPAGGGSAYFVRGPLRPPETLFAEVRYREGVGVWRRH